MRTAKDFTVNITLIAACDLNFAIGFENHLLFKHKEDMRSFRTTTTGHIVIMGRKTFESLGSKPLPKRHNIVVSTTLPFQPPSYYDEEGNTSLEVVDSLEEALRKAEVAQTVLNQFEGPDRQVFVIGGEQLYRAVYPRAQQIILSTIRTRVEHADAFFPSSFLIGDDQILWEKVSVDSFDDPKDPNDTTFIPWDRLFYRRSPMSAVKKENHRVH